MGDEGPTGPTGPKPETKLQGTILSIKKANGEISPVLAGRNVVLKSVEDAGSKRSTKATWFSPQLSLDVDVKPAKPLKHRHKSPQERHERLARSLQDREYHMSMERGAQDVPFESGFQGPFLGNQSQGGFDFGSFAFIQGDRPAAGQAGMTQAVPDELRQAGQVEAPQHAAPQRGVRSKEMGSPEHPEVVAPVHVPGVVGFVEPEVVQHSAPPPLETSAPEESLDIDDILGSTRGSKDSKQMDFARPSLTDTGWEKSVVRILELLETHSKFKKTAFRSRRRFFANLFLSGRLAMWMVILAGPVIIWPIAEFFNSWSERSSKYMASYGMAMSNFCFLLSPNVGMGVRYAIEGVIGTLLALANMLLLNQAFGTYMKGGAYATRTEFIDTALNQTIYRSDWLPLCNLGNGARFITTGSTAEFLRSCFLNVHWSSLSEDGIRAIIVLVDLAAFTALFLGVGFGASTRIYALTYVTFWLMLFVNPGSDAYTEDPSDPWTQSIMTCIGCFLAVVGQFLPCPNTALGSATKLTKELTQSVAAVLESLPFAPRSECQVPLESALQAPTLWLSDLQGLCGAAWFEDMSILPRRARRRQLLEQYVELLAALLQHMTLASRLGAALTPEELVKLEEKLPSLVDVCAHSARALPAPGKPLDPDVMEDLDEAVKSLEQEFSAAVEKFSLTGPILSFTLAVISISTGAVERIRVLEESLPPSPSGICRICRWFSELFVRLELPQTRANPSHKLFVFRSTLAMVLAFLFGWVGLERAMVAYSFGAVVTVSVVVANTGQAGFSLGLIMTRLNSAVIGTVIGQAVQQVLAVQTVFHAVIYGLFIWCFSVFLIFQILHSQDHASTALPVLAIGIGGLVPSTGVFRIYNAQIEPAAEIALAASVKSTVFGGGIMLLIDLFLYSSARGICERQLRKGLKKCQGLLLRVMGLRASTSAANADGSSNEETEVLVHLNQVARLLPFATKEPAPRGIEFPYLLFHSLETSLRAIAIELGTLEWMLEVSSNTALVGQEELAPLLVEIEGFLGKMLTSSLVMFDDICQRKFLSGSAESTDASMIRKDVLAKEYSRISTTQVKPETPKAQTRRLSSIAAMAARRNSDTKTNFSELITQIRTKAMEKRGLLPTSDLYAQIELLVSVLTTVSKEAQKIQIVLAQYG